VTEQQPYTVVRRFDDFEVREYPASAVAEVTVRGSFEQAGNRAFGSLFGYISGRNLGGQSIAMTAPVLQGPSHEGAHAVAFVLPASLPADAAPTPDNASVLVREMPATTTAAITYSGRWTQDSYDRHCATLLAALAREGLTAVGEPRFARYNPPFTPWFLRRNEVLVDVADVPAVAAE
jgi:hypothetical protein